MMQGTLELGSEWQAPVYAVGASHAERWDAVKTANPWIVPTFIGLADEACRRGRSRLGVKWLVEVFRWERSARIVGDGFRFNNNYTAFLARDMIAAEPSLADKINLREQKTL